MSNSDYFKYEGVYVGLSAENIVVICDLFTKGVFIISTVSDSKIIPLGLGEYKIEGSDFIIEPQRAWVFMIPNMKRVVGEFVPKTKLSFNGITVYYHCSIASREPYQVNVDNMEHNPMPERYGKDVMDSLHGFDFFKYDFSKYDLAEALETAGIDADKLAKGKKDEPFFKKKAVVKFSPDRSLLYDKATGKRIPGAYFDEYGNIRYKFEGIKRFITDSEASKTGNWADVSYNLPEDQKKEIKRVAAVNREIQDRIDGVYDQNKKYDEFEDTEDMLNWAGVDDNDSLRELFPMEGNKSFQTNLTADKNDEPDSGENGPEEDPSLNHHDPSANKKITGSLPEESSDKAANNVSEPENYVHQTDAGYLSESHDIYCFGFNKMYYIGGDYIYFVLFMQVQNGVSKNLLLTTTDKDHLNLEGWREIIRKASDKISNSKYLFFVDTSFNFVLDVSDILVNTKLCGSIADIDYNALYRSENLAVSKTLSNLLTDFRPGGSVAESITALISLLKTIGITDVTII